MHKGLLSSLLLASYGLVAEGAVQCLSQDGSNSVSVVSSNGNKYIFGGQAYDLDQTIGVSTGSYKFTGVTAAHPIGFNSPSITVTGGTPYDPMYGDPALGQNVSYYTGDITIDVEETYSGDKSSYMCYIHGYMGGSNRLVYDPGCGSTPSPTPSPAPSPTPSPAPQSDTTHCAPGHICISNNRFLSKVGISNY